MSYARTHRAVHAGPGRSRAPRQTAAAAVRSIRRTEGWLWLKPAAARCLGDGYTGIAGRRAGSRNSSRLRTSRRHCRYPTGASADHPSWGGSSRRRPAGRHGRPRRLCEARGQAGVVSGRAGAVTMRQISEKRPYARRIHRNVRVVQQAVELVQSAGVLVVGHWLASPALAARCQRNVATIGQWGMSLISLTSRWLLGCDHTDDRAASAGAPMEPALAVILVETCRRTPGSERPPRRTDHGG